MSMNLQGFFHLFFICFLVSAQGQNFELVQRFEGHGSAVSYVTFRSEDNLLVSGDEEGRQPHLLNRTGGR